jgi:hypothetical protein
MGLSTYILPTFFGVRPVFFFNHGLFCSSHAACREAHENAIKRSRGNALVLVFDMGFLPESFCGVFELLLLRSAEKRD